MTLEEKLLALDVEGFYIEESVLSPMQAKEVRGSTKATLLEGAEKIFGSTFLNHNQSLAPYLANHKILEVVRSILGPNARIISTSGNMSPPSPGAKSAPPGNLHVDWPWGQSGTSYWVDREWVAKPKLKPPSGISHISGNNSDFYDS